MLLRQQRLKFYNLNSVGLHFLKMLLSVVVVVWKMPSSRKMPLQLVIEVKIFDIHDIDFMCPCPISNWYAYTLMDINYVFKWVEAISTRANDRKINLKFTDQNIFFLDLNNWEQLLVMWGHILIIINFNPLWKNIVHHRVTTPYHPLENGQVEISNREIENKIKKIISLNGKDWSSKLYDTFWAYTTTYETPLGMSPNEVQSCRHKKQTSMHENKY